MLETPAFHGGRFQQVQQTNQKHRKPRLKPVKPISPKPFKKLTHIGGL
jgi:hypothetical protein